MYTAYFMRDNQAQKFIAKLWEMEILFVVNKSWFNVIAVNVYDKEEFAKQLEKDLKA